MINGFVASFIRVLQARFNGQELNWFLCNVNSFSNIKLLYAWNAKNLIGVQVRLMNFKDKRVKFMTELLNGIKACLHRMNELTLKTSTLLILLQVVKLYAWEQPFGKVVYSHRDREVPVLFQTFIIVAISTQHLLQILVFTYNYCAIPYNYEQCLWTDI